MRTQAKTLSDGTHRNRRTSSHFSKLPLFCTGLPRICFIGAAQSERHPPLWAPIHSQILRSIQQLKYVMCMRVQFDSCTDMTQLHPAALWRCAARSRRVARSGGRGLRAQRAAGRADGQGGGPRGE
jgi:hypothetical protein